MNIEEVRMDEDIAEILVWIACRPPHVNIDELIVKPVDQADVGKVFRRRRGRGPSKR